MRLAGRRASATPSTRAAPRAGNPGGACPAATDQTSTIFARTVGTTFMGSARLMPDELTGKDYRAVTRLSNGDDDVTYADAGETCERVPAESLPGLLTHGYIARVAPAPSDAPSV